MTHFTLQVAAAGPLLTAFIGVSQQRGEALTTAVEQIPTAVRVQALVDTGASCTCVDPSVPIALNLTPTGSVPVYTPTTSGTPETKDQYDASLVIPGADASHMPLNLPAIALLAVDLRDQGIDVLIGRDILQDCVFVYNGTRGWFTLAF